MQAVNTIRYDTMCLMKEKLAGDMKRLKDLQHMPIVHITQQTIIHST